MAFGALYNWFKAFRKTPFFNWAYYYNEFVLKTPEQREAEKKASDKQAVQSLLVMKMMTDMMVEKLSDRSSYYLNRRNLYE